MCERIRKRDAGKGHMTGACDRDMVTMYIRQTAKAFIHRKH